jgi:hypothetical protein
MMVQSPSYDHVPGSAWRDGVILNFSASSDMGCPPLRAGKDIGSFNYAVSGRDE